MKFVLLAALSIWVPIFAVVDSQSPCIITKFGEYCGNCVEYKDYVKCIGCVISEHGGFCGDDCMCYEDGCECGPSQPTTRRTTSTSQPPHPAIYANVKVSAATTSKIHSFVLITVSALFSFLQ